MNTVRAFVTKAGYVDNTVKKVNTFFELSPFALTFSKKRGEYQSSHYPGDVLHTFVTQNDTGSYTLPATQVDEVLLVVKKTLDYMTTHVFPYSAGELQSSVLAALSGTISSLSFGEFYSTPELTIPEWIEWKSVDHPDTNVRVWVRNEAFENQFSEYEIVVVPPIDNLDRFFTSYGTVSSELEKITASDTISRIQDWKDGDPESYTRVQSFRYYNPVNKDQFVDADWGVLIYGKNGDNIDAIKDAIVEYTTKKSTRPVDDWKDVFPDIFKRTEFLLWPRWDKISIPNITTLAALYSSVCDPSETYDFAAEKWPGVTPDWLGKNLSVFPFDYKAIQVVVLNGSSNIAGKERITDLFPDYIPVGTASLDFNRMEPVTRDWILAMVELITVAETATEYTSIENPIRKVYRDGVLYLTRMIDQVNYLVAVRANK